MAGVQLLHAPLAGLCSCSPLHPSNGDQCCALYQYLIMRVVFDMFLFSCCQDFTGCACSLPPGQAEWKVKGFFIPWASGMDSSKTSHQGGVSSLSPSTSTHPRGCIMKIITLPHRDTVRTETTYETHLAQKKSPVSISSPSPASHLLPTHAFEL